MYQRFTSVSFYLNFLILIYHFLTFLCKYINFTTKTTAFSKLRSYNLAYERSLIRNYLMTNLKKSKLLHLSKMCHTPEIKSGNEVLPLYLYSYTF